MAPDASHASSWVSKELSVRWSCPYEKATIRRRGLSTRWRFKVQHCHFFVGLLDGWLFALCTYSVSVYGHDSYLGNIKNTGDTLSKFL
ncbi:transmembrane protein, putative [Medicago truncatula]|uniref:Transmembrane protein, putative n=1 Tax=Medicago truncatula TaxID=3880 RepID=A0A072UHZ0_MEDTR|nr:transmembrane protein, putative [Medicago truncatula]